MSSNYYIEIILVVWMIFTSITMTRIQILYKNTVHQVTFSFRQTCLVNTLPIWEKSDERKYYKAMRRPWGSPCCFGKEKPLKHIYNPTHPQGHFIFSANHALITSIFSHWINNYIIHIFALFFVLFTYFKVNFWLFKQINKLW